MWCYSNTCANDGLIRLNKLVGWITDAFYNLFFINILTPIRDAINLQGLNEQGLKMDGLIDWQNRRGYLLTVT